MNIILIRHGAVQGNLEGRYIGSRTDTPLCPAGIEQLRHSTYPAVEAVFISPMLRCSQSAQIIYPGITPRIVPDLRECDFGVFEGLNYAELDGDPRYQAWIDSGGTLPFPGGEDQASFADRTLSAFREILRMFHGQNAAIVAHGGTVMAIMEAYALPHRSYFDWRIKNGSGFILNPDTGAHQEI